MSSHYKEPRRCQCGYTTISRTSFSSHRKSCVQVLNEKYVLKTEKEKEINDLHRLWSQRMARLDMEIRVQLQEKDRLLRDKDIQIRELAHLAAKARIVHKTNNYVVDNKVNIFGSESRDHISPQRIQAIMADPPNAVSQFIKLKHRRAPGGINDNVRVPNKKRAIYQVVVRGEGSLKEWENRSKIDVLEQMYDENSGELEAEADDESRLGQVFLDHQDRVRASAEGEDRGKKYKEQLEKIHFIFTQ